MPMVTVEVSCFTDIAGYGSQEKRLGHKASQQIVNDYLRAGRALIELNGGEYHKNIGDAHMATFRSLEGALRFATELQQMYASELCLVRDPVGVRVSLCLGLVEPVSSEVFGTDAFGPGVITAKRQESHTEPTRITVDRDLRNKMFETWGKRSARRYFRSIGKHELKGLNRAAELFAFDWRSYAVEHPLDSLGQRVFACLEKSGVVAANLSADGLTPPGTVLWPVVPRDIATAIHRAQIEILRLLAFLGWEVHLLIADCMPLAEPRPRRLALFVKAIRDHALSRGLKIGGDSVLSDYFRPDYERLGQCLDSFQRTTQALTLQNLIDISQKEYSEQVRDEIKANSALYFLLPVLTCSVVSHLATLYSEQRPDARTIAVCGLDEQIQWSALLDLPPVRQRLSILHNPILKESSMGGPAHTVRQRADWPIWYSQHELLEVLEHTNAGKWLFQLFTQLPCFPSDFVPAESALGNLEARSAEDWGDEFGIPEWLDRKRLVDAVWPIIDTARGSGKAKKGRDVSRQGKPTRGGR